MAITANTGSSGIPTLGDVVTGLFTAARRLPEDVEQTDYTRHNELVFYDFIDGRMTTQPTFGRTVYAQSRSWAKRYDGMSREEGLKHIKSRITRNRVQLIEQLNRGLVAHELITIDHDCYGVMGYSPALQTLGDSELRYRSDWRWLVMVFGGYAHPDAITDKQIDEFAITWTNYRALADQGHEFFKRVCSVAPIADRIDACIKDRREELLGTYLPQYLAREMGIIESISQLLGVFSQEEILDALSSLNTEVDGRLLSSQALLLGDIISCAEWSDIDHAGARCWIRTVLSKAKPGSGFDRVDAEAARLLKIAKALGVHDFAVEITPTARYSSLRAVEELLSKLDTEGVEYYLDEASKAFVMALGVEDEFPRLHKAKSYALGNYINESLRIVRLT
mgnify:FL=1